MFLKVAHNPSRPRYLTPASIWLCGTESVFFSSLKMSNFVVGIQSLGIALKKYLIPNYSPLFSLVLPLFFFVLLNAESNLINFPLQLALYKSNLYVRGSTGANTELLWRQLSGRVEDIGSDNILVFFQRRHLQCISCCEAVE